MKAMVTALVFAIILSGTAFAQQVGSEPIGTMPAASPAVQLSATSVVSPSAHATDPHETWEFGVDPHETWEFGAQTGGYYPDGD